MHGSYVYEVQVKSADTRNCTITIKVDQQAHLMQYWTCSAGGNVYVVQKKSDKCGAAPSQMKSTCRLK